MTRALGLHTLGTTSPRANLHLADSSRAPRHYSCYSKGSLEEPPSLIGNQGGLGSPCSRAIPWSMAPNPAQLRINCLAFSVHSSSIDGVRDVSRMRSRCRSRDRGDYETSVRTLRWVYKAHEGGKMAMSLQKGQRRLKVIGQFPHQKGEISSARR